MSPARFDEWLQDPSRPPLVMGVLNVTPDSFSDGGRFYDAAAAVAHAEAMAADGADLIDVGGESTRPGSLPVEAAEQIRRIVPVLRAVSGRLPGVTLSVDTTRAEVAAAALDAGAHVINDVSGGRDDAGMLPLAARAARPIVLMHMQGTPATMQINPAYSDVAAEVAQFLRDRLAAAVDAGVRPDRVLLDPGIGFGKTVAHNLALLRRMRDLAAVGRPLVVGTSRKGFIARILGEPVTPAPPESGASLAAPDRPRRLFGTAATVAWAVANGASIVRVHDVGPMAQVVRVVRSIQTGETGAGAAG